MAVRKWLIRGFMLLLTLSAGGAYYVYGQYTNPDTVAHLVLQELQEHFPGSDIQLGRAQWSLLSGVKLSELRLTPGGETQPTAILHQTVLQIDKAQAARGKFALQRVHLHQPHLHLERDEAGRWNVLHLLTAKPTSSGVIPFVTLQDGYIRFHDRKLALPILELKEVQAKFTPASTGELRGEGTALSDVLGPVHFQFTHQPESGTTQLTLSLRCIECRTGVELIFDRFIPAWREWQLQLDGQINLQTVLTWNGDSAIPKVRSTLHLAAGEIRQPQLPIPLRDLHAEFEYADACLVMKSMKARADQGIIRGHGSLELGSDLGQLSSHRAQVHLDYEQIRLHAGLYPSLPPMLRRFCSEFQAEGMLNGTMDAVWKDQKLGLSYVLHPYQGSFEAVDFPYPAREVQGQLRYEETGEQPLLHIELTGRFGERKFKLGGRLFGWGLRPEIRWKPGVDIAISADAVPLDDQLLRALQPYPETQSVVKQFHAQGNFDCAVRLQRDAGSQQMEKPPLRRWVTAQLKDVRFRFEEFPCPIEKASALLELFPDLSWRFTQFKGEHRGGLIQGLGWLTSTRAGDVLHFDLTAKQLPFSPELRGALPGEIQDVWDHIRPSGRADCQVLFDKLEKGKPVVEVSLKPRGAQARLVSFPYPLHNIRGKIRCRGRQIDIQSMTAEHGDTAISLGEGQVTIRPGQGFLAQLHGIAFDRLMADEEFQNALPGLMREALQTIRPAGPINARFDLDINSDGSARPISLNWSGNLELQQTRLQCGCTLDDVTGLIVLDRGSYQNGKLETVGRIFLHTMSLAGKQALGPLSAKVYLTSDQLQLHECRASLPGGLLQGLVEVKFGGVPRFHLDLGAELQLERWWRKTDGPSGRAHAKLVLSGEGSAQRNLQGSGSLYIKDGANLYQLPLIIDIVNQFSQVFPKATQFQEAKLDFSIQGDRLVAEQVQVLADAYKLEGYGSARVDGTNLDLLLTFVMGAGRSFPLMPATLEKMQSTFARGLMKIHVTGSVEQVKVHVEPLPFVVEPLKDLYRSLVK